MPLVLTCAAQDFDVSTGVCSHQVWIDSPTVLPPLSVSDGLVLSSAILGLWAIAFGLRFIRRFIWSG